MTEYELIEMDNGELGVLSPNGSVIPARMLDLILELGEKHPDFFEHWISLGESHAFHSYGSVKA